MNYAQIEGLEKKDPFKEKFSTLLQETMGHVLDHSIRVVPDSIGEPAALLDFHDHDFFLAFKTDGVGTKSVVAEDMVTEAQKGGWHKKRILNLFAGLGQDLVASNVNDIVCLGAAPIALSDEIAAGHFSAFTNKMLIDGLFAGLKKGCIEAGITIPSGESPTLTDIIKKGRISITGSSIGIVRPRSRAILGSSLSDGDIIVGLLSSGIHTNGLAMARKISVKLRDGYFTRFRDTTVGEEILTPTKIYTRPILEMIEKNVEIHYITHISGGAFRKVSRAKKPYTYLITALPPKPAILSFLQEKGQMSDYDAYQTWNMGVGMILFMPHKEYKRAEIVAQKHGIGILHMGYVKRGKRRVVIEPLNIEY